ncbi:outer dynein arm-docking complex subunit 1-like isoform X2 [Eleginops maclovinus]
MSRRSSAGRSLSLVDYSETDLNKLQQQYRKAEGTKKAYTEKTQVLICRDRQEIQRLQDEREKHVRSLRFSQSRFTRWSDASVVQDLTDMLVSGDKIDQDLQAEKGKGASLKEQIVKWERKLAEQKTGGGTSQCSIKPWRYLLKNTFFMESKLHRATKCFNTTMTRNGELRDELKTMQVEKKQFLHVQSRLGKELHALRKDIGNLMAKCTEALNASVKCQERHRILMEQNSKDVAQFIKQSSSLEQDISRNCKFEVFLDIKDIVRNIPDTGDKVKRKQLDSKELAPQDFEDAIKKILEVTEEKDMDKLVRNFLQMEEHNFTLLKCVNYQQNEAETLRRQISQRCIEREMFVAEKQRQQDQHQALQVKVSIRQEAMEQQLAGFQMRVDFMEKLLDQLKEGVESLLQISCDSFEICPQLGSSDGVQDENIPEYLRKVENRVNELLSLQSFLYFQDNINSQWDMDSLSTIAGQLLGKTPTAVNLPSAAETPAPVADPDLVESVLLEAKEPVRRDDLLTLVNNRAQRKKKTD